MIDRRPATKLAGAKERHQLLNAVRDSVFELAPQANGMWTEKIAHRFGSGTDGNGPLGDVTFDASGQLFGTTIGGGTNHEGTVWKIKF